MVTRMVGSTVRQLYSASLKQQNSGKRHCRRFLPVQREYDSHVKQSGKVLADKLVSSS